jgi:hypothetical protein
MFGTKETAVQLLVAHLQARSEGIGMRAALDEAHDVLREAQRRVGHGGHGGDGGLRGGYLTKEPVARWPGLRA